MHCKPIPQDNGERISRFLNIQEEMRITKQQPIYGFAGTDIGDFYNALIEDCKSHGWTVGSNIHYLMDQAFSYGIIQGKRAERARMRARTLSAISPEPSGRKASLNLKPPKLEKENSMNDSSVYKDAIRQLIDGCEDLEYITAVYSFAAAYPKKKKG